MGIFEIRLKDQRLAKGLSQKQLAQLLDTTNSSVCDWERGRAEPDVKILQKLSGIFNVSVDYLLGLSDEFGGVTGGVSSQAISPDEEEILALFRAMSKTQRTRLVAFGEGLLSGSDTWHKSLNRPKKA